MLYLSDIIRKIWRVVKYILLPVVVFTALGFTVSIGILFAIILMYV